MNKAVSGPPVHDAPMEWQFVDAVREWRFQPRERSWCAELPFGFRRP